MGASLESTPTCALVAKQMRGTHIPPRGAGPQGVGGQYTPALQRFHFGIDESDLKLVVPECDAELLRQEQEEQEPVEGHQPGAVELAQGSQRHIIYEDEVGEVQVHEPFDLSSSEE